MNDNKKSKDGAEEGIRDPRAAKNDGPDETPVYADLYHDEGRRNALEEDDPGEPGGQEKGDDL